MVVKRLAVVLFSSILLSVIVTPSARAGGGCGVSIPTASSTFIKPGQSFNIDFSFIQFDSDINYADPKIAPEVNFSSSVTYLQQRMIFSGLDSNNWAKYRATFQIPSNFVGNQNLQAVLIYPSCEGATRTITYGPQITITSDSAIPTCIIEDLQVNDYSVKIGESFKVGFKIISPIANLNPIIELTDSESKRVIQARLAGNSGTDLKIYEATISYTQAFQYNYGAIARAVVSGMCNSSGQRQVIGINGHVTSMAMLQPTYPDFPCEAKGISIMTKTNQLKNEELFCNPNPERGNTLTWMKIQAADKIETPNPTPSACIKEGARQRVDDLQYVCIYDGTKLVYLTEVDAAPFLELKRVKIALEKVIAAANFQRASLFVEAKKLKDKSMREAILNQIDIWGDFLRRYSSKEPSSEYVRTGETELAQLSLSTTELIALSKKLISITCIKGKKTKKVSETNPKCPKGYKKVL